MSTLSAAAPPAVVLSSAKGLEETHSPSTREQTFRTPSTVVADRRPVVAQQELDSPATIDFMESDEFAELEYSQSELDLVRELTAVAGGSAGRRGDTVLGALLDRSLPPLAADEERILFRRMNYVKFQAGALQSTLAHGKPSREKTARIGRLLDEAEQIQRRIVESNLRLVASIARRYSHSPQELAEFVSDGLLILLGAIQKFDYSRGFRFSTYATHAVQRHYFRATRRMHTYQQRFLATPGDVLENVIEYEEEPQLGPDAATIYQQLMESARGQLTRREESVLHRRFGTDGEGAGRTLREVASELGISKERVRQIQISALAKLRAVAADCNLLPTAG
jgi:RNA polymerase primary sigma factor